MREKTVTRFSILLISIAFLVIVPVIAADSPAMPQLPHTFYGKVMVGDTPGGQGLIVEVVGPGVRSNIPFNPVTTMSGGYYGVEGATNQRLVVQGTLSQGTPLDFYIGGLHADVYDVAAGGPWKENYTYEPGGYTELTLRITSSPSPGQTREPTPVQTPLASSTSALGGPLLPQLPESSGQLPANEGSSPSPADSGQSGTTGQGENPAAGSSVSGSQDNTGGTVALPVSGNLTILIAAGIALLLIVAGGAYYFAGKKKSESEKTEEPEKKDE